MAHAQESSTVWDKSVRKAGERPLDQDWFDLNLGVWFSDYAGHDEVYVLDRRGLPIYAMQDGKRSDPSSYLAIRNVVDPLVARLRKTKEIEARHDDMTMLSPGAAEFAILRGHPAIVSAKPLISDTGDIVQRPGSEPVHISVVRLDDSFMLRFARQYGLTGAHISRSSATHWMESSVPLLDASGAPIAFLVWKPFAPGNDVTTLVGPVLVIALLSFAVAISLLAARLKRKTVDLEMSKLQAQHLAMHDVLTGLPNRAMFELRLEEALGHLASEGGQIALLYLDLDHFKQINDSLGHSAGDALIREVAWRLSAIVRECDTVARVGGDEFAIILVDPKNHATIERVGSRIVSELRLPFDLMGSQSFIGASAGIALAPTDGDDRLELTRKADIALYRAKSEGRGKYVFFTSDMDEAIRTRETVDRELRLAILDSQNQLKVHYQPVLSTLTETFTAVEALVRWDHPERGLLSPIAFLGIAEDSGLIEALGELVLRAAVRDAMRWPELRISVNVSPIQVRNRSFADRVISILGEAGMHPSRLELELTETAFLTGLSDVSRTIERLRNVGISIALDDFGTGYSSLSHIRDLAVDRIKIDRSFVTALDTGQGVALVQAIITMATASGLEITAEGVETDRQRELLEQLGCTEIQGYRISPPLPADEMDNLVKAMAGPGGRAPTSRAA